MLFCLALNTNVLKQKVNFQHRYNIAVGDSYVLYFSLISFFPGERVDDKCDIQCVVVGAIVVVYVSWSGLTVIQL